MKSSSHFFVFSAEPGSFRYGENLPKGATCHGRFVSKPRAQAHVVQLKRDFLSPLNWPDGTALTIKERVIVGVWGWDPAQWPYSCPKASDAAAGSVTLVQGIVGEGVLA